MKYTQVKNPIWANAEHTVINCEVDFDGLIETFVPFSAVATGDYEHTHQIFAECVAGNYGEIAEFKPYVSTAENNKANAVNLLTQTDWATVADVADSNISNPYLTNQQAFYDFRNIVRAIAINPVAGDIDFPEIPTATWSS
jgi:hypothetical protein